MVINIFQFSDPRYGVIEIIPDILAEPEVIFFNNDTLELYEYVRFAHRNSNDYFRHHVILNNFIKTYATGYIGLQF